MNGMTPRRRSHTSVRRSFIGKISIEMERWKDGNMEVRKYGNMEQKKVEGVFGEEEKDGEEME